jgi:hypothetical protein
MLRVGSFMLALFGGTRKVQEAPVGAAGRESLALKLIFAPVFVIFWLLRALSAVPLSLAVK